MGIAPCIPGVAVSQVSRATALTLRKIVDGEGRQQASVRDLAQTKVGGVPTLEGSRASFSIVLFILLPANKTVRLARYRGGEVCDQRGRRARPALAHAIRT